VDLVSLAELWKSTQCSRTNKKGAFVPNQQRPKKGIADHTLCAFRALTPLHLPAREVIDAATHGGKDPVSHGHDETCDHWALVRISCGVCCSITAGDGSGLSGQPKWRQSGSRIQNEELRTLDCGRGERGNESRS
jgi:hypothetical protein